jgi:hypothetical protein
MQYANVETNAGVFPVTLPNSIQEGTGFYVSYNDYDTGTYGCDTTALVFGQMQAFYILNGDHRVAYAKLLEAGFDACLGYFKENLVSVNKFSETLTLTP